MVNIITKQNNNQKRIFRRRTQKYLNEQVLEEKVIDVNYYNCDDNDDDDDEINTSENEVGIFKRIRRRKRLSKKIRNINTRIGIMLMNTVDLIINSKYGRD